MIKFAPYYVTTAQLNVLPIKEGQFIINTETKEMFLDIGTDRLTLIDSATAGNIDTEISDTSINPVQNSAIAAALKLKLDIANIDTEISETSENPVQNKAIFSALNNKLSTDSIDTALSGTSENPVQNKVITESLATKINSTQDTNAAGFVLTVGADGVVSPQPSKAVGVWEPNKQYNLNDLVINGTAIYICIVAHTSGAMFDNTELASWSSIAGEKGEDGYSPSITVAPNAKGVIITVEDANGTTTASLLNGEDGADGANGKSAYELAVEQGFIGDEAAWLESLKGAVELSTQKVDLTCKLAVDGWTSTLPYTQTVEVRGMTARLNPRVDVIISPNVATGKKEEKSFNYITRISTGDGFITAYCYEFKPLVDLNLMIEVV